MEPVSLTAGAIATLVLTKVTEKASEKLGEQVVKKAGELLSLLKIKLPNTANAIELSQQQPLDSRKAIFDLGAAMEDSAVAKAVIELDTVLKTDPKIYQTIQTYATVLNSHAPTLQNRTNIIQNIDKVVNLQGEGSSLSMRDQNINI